MPRNPSIAPSVSRVSSALRGKEHDKGLHDVLAQVETIEKVGLSVQRIGVRLLTPEPDANWSAANVAFRLHLSHGDEDLSRIYTVRDSDAQGRLRFDVVLHEGSSPMMQWIANLEIGDTFGITGPRPHMGIPETHGREVALFLDETAIPALYSLLKCWPEGVTGAGWVVTCNAATFAELPQVEGLQLEHLVPSGDGDLLLARAKELRDAATKVVWAAGERREMRSIRQHFLAQGVLKNDLAITGYWGRGLSNTQIDERRKADYEAVLARGGTLADYDDLAVEV